MRHVRLENWGRLDSTVHRRHAASKVLASLAFLIAIATLPSGAVYASAMIFILLAATALAARLPLLSLLATSAAVLPFAFCFALITALSGEPGRALMLIVRSYLSSLTALLLIATTPMPELLAGLELMQVPRFLVQVMQFLYRYLIVLLEEAAAMREAGLSRAASVRSFALKHAIGAVSVLFARSYDRARAIHRAMIARGFDGHIPRFTIAVFRVPDAVFVLVAAALAIGIRVVLK